VATVHPRLTALLIALLLLWPTVALTDSQDLETLNQQRTTLSGQLDVVKGEEAGILTDLFNLNRSLDQIQQQIHQTQADMAKVEQALQETVQQENDLKARYQLRQEQFGRRIRFMAEHGAATYFEVILNATDLQDFVWRLGLVQAFIRRDAQLLTDVRSLRQQVVAKEAELQSQRQQLSDLNGRLVAEQTELEGTIQTKNDRLAALKDQRGYYEQSLETLDKVWSEKVVPLLRMFGQSFHTLAEHVTEMKPSKFDVSFFPTPNARVIVKTADLNAFVQQFPDLRGLSFTLEPAKANLTGDFSGATLQIEGTFVIVGKTVLRYNPAKISFAGLPVDGQYTRDLVAGGGLDFDLSTLVTGWKLDSATVDTDMVTIKASYSP